MRLCCSPFYFHLLRLVGSKFNLQAFILTFLFLTEPDFSRPRIRIAPADPDFEHSLAPRKLEKNKINTKTKQKQKKKITNQIKAHHRQGPKLANGAGLATARLAHQLAAIEPSPSHAKGGTKSRGGEKARKTKPKYKQTHKNTPCLHSAGLPILQLNLGPNCHLVDSSFTAIAAVLLND